jgi:hypothetical protein
VAGAFSGGKGGTRPVSVQGRYGLFPVFQGCFTLVTLAAFSPTQVFAPGHGIHVVFRRRSVAIYQFGFARFQKICQATSLGQGLFSISHVHFTVIIFTASIFLGFPWPTVVMRLYFLL